MSHLFHTPVRMLLVLATCTLLGACGEEDSQPPPIRSVKVETLQTSGPAETVIIGSVRRSSHAQLSFDQAGRVESVRVDVGDSFGKGDVLAVSDQLPAQQQLTRAQAKATAAKSAVAEARLQYAQKSAMFDDGSISTLSFAQAKSAMATAQAELRVALTDVELAKRAVDRNFIRAPFDGQVTARHAEPSVDLAAGQAVLDVQGKGKTEVSANAPIQLADELKSGAIVSAQQDGGPPVPLIVRSVSDHEVAAGMVIVQLETLDEVPSLRAGSLVRLNIQQQAVARSRFLPISSLLPTASPGSADVFIYLPNQQRVKKIRVHLGAIQGAWIEVIGELESGTQVVTAGASYLTDGQRVRLFVTDSLLNQGDR